MPNMKPTDIVVLKKIFKEMDPSKEQDYLNRLSEEQRHIYKDAMYSTMLPIEIVDEMYHHGAECLFPNASDKYIAFGKFVSERSFSTVYKIFMRIPTRKFVIGKASAVWQNYHEKGEAKIENLTDKSGDFVVYNYPELTKVLRLVAGGHLAKMLELIGTKDVHVNHIDTNPNEWRWQIDWKL